MKDQNILEYNDKVKDIFSQAKALRDRIPESKKIPIVKEELPKQENLPARYQGLSGIKIREDGTITKTNYLDLLNVDEDKYGHLTFSEAEIKQISNQMKRLTTGINAAVPIRCTGDQCAFKNSCPYFQIGKPPLGQSCLVEAQLIHYWTEQYLEEFNVDPNHITEMHLVSELAEFNIYEMRITKYLAENHQTLLQDVMTGVDPNGNIIQNQEISRAFDLKERIKKNRMKVLEALMATRKEKLKVIATVSEKTSSSSKMADLKSKIFELSKQVEKMKVVDGEVIE